MTYTTNQWKSKEVADHMTYNTNQNNCTEAADHMTYTTTQWNCKEVADHMTYTTNQWNCKEVADPGLSTFENGNEGDLPHRKMPMREIYRSVIFRHMFATCTNISNND